jgi:3'-5' exoribonuclease
MTSSEALMTPEQKKRDPSIVELRAGERFRSRIFLLHERDEALGRNGKAYLRLGFSDQSGNIRGKAWDVATVPEQANGRAVRVAARVDEYQGVLQLIVEHLEILPEDEVPIERLMRSSRYGLDELDRRLDALLQEIRDPWLSQLMAALLAEDGLRERLLRAPAAKRIHHAYVGGLLEHSLSMAAVYRGIAAHYEAYYPGLLDHDLMLVGILLHDIGKVDELDPGPGFTYTDSGQLLGHIFIGSARVGRVAARIEGFPPERLEAIQHLILSHHGELEYGSPVRPRMAEAVLLHYLDQIDSKLNHARAMVEEVQGDASWSAPSRIFEGALRVPTNAPGAPAPARPPAPAPSTTPTPRAHPTERAKAPEPTLSLFPDE